MDLGKTQASLRCVDTEPLADPLLLGQELLLHRAGRKLARDRAQAQRDRSGQLFGRLIGAGDPAEFRGQFAVAADRLAAPACGQLNGCDRLGSAETPQDFEDLPHIHLAVAHCTHLQSFWAREQWTKGPFGVGWGMLVRKPSG